MPRSIEPYTYLVYDSVLPPIKIILAYFNSKYPINIVIALAVEAAPLISHFKLTRCNLPQLPFKIYQNHNISLIISGMGNINSAAATAYLGVFTQSSPKTIWLNVGIGGHRHFEIGSAHLISELQAEHLPRSFRLSLPPMPLCSTTPVYNVLTPTQEYPKEAIVEMESLGFYTTASKFCSSTQILLIKVISDNQKTSLNHLSKNQVSQLISQHKQLISTQILSIATDQDK